MSEVEGIWHPAATKLGTGFATFGAQRIFQYKTFRFLELANPTAGPRLRPHAGRRFFLETAKHREQMVAVN